MIPVGHTHICVNIAVITEYLFQDPRWPIHTCVIIDVITDYLFHDLCRPLHTFVLLLM